MSTTYYLVNKEQYNERKKELSKIKRFIERTKEELENSNIEYNDSILFTLGSNLEDELFHIEEIAILRTSWGGVDIGRKVTWIENQEYIDDIMRSGEYLLIDEYDEHYTLEEFYEKMK